METNITVANCFKRMFGFANISFNNCISFHFPPFLIFAMIEVVL